MFAEDGRTSGAAVSPCNCWLLGKARALAVLVSLAPAEPRESWQSKRSAGGGGGSSVAEGQGACGLSPEQQGREGSSLLEVLAGAAAVTLPSSLALSFPRQELYVSGPS